MDPLVPKLGPQKDHNLGDTRDISYIRITKIQKQINVNLDVFDNYVIDLRRHQ